MTEQEQRKLDKMKLKYREQILDLQKFVKLLSCIILILFIVIVGLSLLLILPEKDAGNQAESGNQMTQDGENVGTDGDFEMDYIETDRYEITRNDVVVSIKKNIRISHNGGGGFSMQEAITYDAATGLLLSLDDLLADKDGFYAEIDELIMEQLGLYPEMAEACSDYEEEYKKEYMDQGILPGWVLRENGMAFMFEDGQFLSYIDTLEITVPYEQLRTYLKSEYLPAE